MIRPIAIFNGRLLPASETFIKSQAEGLKKFTPYYVGARLVNGLTVPQDRTIIVNQGKYFGNIAELLFKQIGFAPKFYQELKMIDPQLIHAHFGVCGTLALPIAKKLNIPLIVTFHGFDASMTDEYARKDSITTRVYLRRREELKKDTKLFIAVSNFIKNKLIKQGFPEDKIKVHYIGINIEKFKPNFQIVRQRKVLFAGRLVEKKGCEYLIRAMAQVQVSNPDVELIVIGDGPLRKQLESLAAQFLKYYSFLGVQSQEKVKALMNQAYVLVAPSITTKDGDTEGLPIVILEAQAMGLPVIGSNHAGIPEAIIDGETGFLIEEGNETAIAKQILQLLNNSNCWNHISNSSIVRVCSDFNLHTQIDKLEAIYHQILV